MTLLRVQDLTISRTGSDAHIVRSANFSLESGQTLGIAGESGCGKSTLLLALIGVVKQGLSLTGGQVHVMGQDLRLIAPEEISCNGAAKCCDGLDAHHAGWGPTGRGDGGA